LKCISTLAQLVENKTFIPGIEPAFANFEKPAFKTKLWFAKIEKPGPTSNLAPK